MPSKSSKSDAGRPPRQNSRNGLLNDDAMAAQALQDQYRKEFLERQARKNARARGHVAVPVNRDSSSGSSNHNRRRSRSRSQSRTRASSTSSSDNPLPAPSAPPEETVWAYDPSQGEVVEIPMGNPEQVGLGSRHVDTSTMAVSDEDYARRLQQEIEREEIAMGVRRPSQPESVRHKRKSNSQSRSRNSSSNPTRVVRGRPVSTPVDVDDVRLSQMIQDEELAQRLSGGRDRTSSSRHVPSTEFFDEGLAWGRKDSTDTFPASNSEDIAESNDRAYAARIAQEMDDAEMANRLANYEQEAQSRRQVQEERTSLQRQARNSRLFGRVLPLLCCGVGVAVGLLFVLGVFDTSDIFGDDWVDPFEGVLGGDVSIITPPGEVPDIADLNVYAWPNDGRGITLEVLNAMEDKWQTMLQVALDNWDQGYPVDSLTLPVTRIDYEYDCEGVSGKLKVCNGNYGANRWRGLNELILEKRTGRILNSAAKINEYYLEGSSNRDKDQQLYTLCHEIGHGFGLPHWDEDFTNADLGNCMDYTNNPGANKIPDATNFMFLAQLYGGINVTTGELAVMDAIAPSVSSASDTAETNTPEEEAPQKDDKKKKKKDDRQLHAESYQHPWARLLQQSEDETKHLVSRVPTTSLRHTRRRRILYATESSEVHHVEEVNGDPNLIKLQVYLMVSPDEEDDV